MAGQCLIYIKLQKCFWDFLGQALAQYIGYLGLPPVKMIKESPLVHTCISEVPIPETSFEEFVIRIPPSGEKEKFFKIHKKTIDLRTGG
ncbi:hypothetical protein PRK78_006372 [Emydomyces testavorans]|uniref:Uncharacterized protein n=1 Tax=Emydomyces testavorans TaxID=2070801 RepID=A0AAF0INJ2_9EURO|nr:hypothetical protein PRK78_006372 [Emydomyces testavorans]